MNLITPDLGIIFWQTIILLVVLVVLGKFAWKPILQVLNERENYIKKSLENAQEANQLLAQMKTEQAKLLEDSTREREKLVNEAVAAKNAILASATTEAKQLGEKLLKATKETLEAEKQLAFNSLKSEVALLSVQIAEKILGRELSKDNNQEELVRSLMKDKQLY
jgi:F-type H+-transporting ATPase subunit b